LIVELTAPAFLIAGLATSPHCALMCGAVSATHLQTRGALTAAHAQLVVNLGRVSGYALLGALAAGAGSWLLPRLPGEAIGRWLQLGAALAMILVGALQMRARAARPACCAQPPLRFALGPVPVRLFLQGLLWAALPCGVLYGVLLLASFSGTAAQGALLAGAFGLGTTPLLWASGALVGTLGRRRTALRSAAGLALMLIGAAMTIAIAVHGADPLGWCVAHA